MKKKPVVLLLGSTGQLGSLIAAQLKDQSSISLRITSRKKAQLQYLSKQFSDVRFLDYDDPKSFKDAFSGVDRMFLLTGYTFSMVVQSKVLIDFARQAGVKHIVHLGVFSLDKDCTVPHFAWHQMIEDYIKQRGIKWTNIHPNCFLRNLLNFSLIKNGKLRWYAQDIPCGWVAIEDVAEAVAKILVEGPDKHQGKDYWFSTESMNVFELAEILYEVTQIKVIPDPKSWDKCLIDSCLAIKGEDPYIYSVEESFKQIENGGMSYIGSVKDDFPKLLGRNGISIRQWMELHKLELIWLASISSGEVVWGGR